MARKHLIYSYNMLDAADATAEAVGSVSDVSQLDKASIHVVFSEANTGELILEARNGDSAPWYELDFGSPNIITAETECQLILNELPFTAIRLTWDPSSGAGTVTAKLTSKTVGG